MRLDTIPFRQAKWYIETPARLIDFVVLHDMEAPELLSTAEAVGNYFATTDKKASTHYGIDADSICQYVDLKDVCYGAGGCNRNGIHIEHAGYANQSFNEWLDDYGVKMLTLSSQLVAELCRIYVVPIKFIDAAGILRGERGITTHLEVDKAFRPPDPHHDPGEDFPMEYFISEVEDTNMDQPTFATFLAKSLGNPDAVRTIDNADGVRIVQIKARDVAAEKTTGVAPQFAWFDWGAIEQYTLYEATIDA